MGPVYAFQANKQQQQQQQFCSPRAYCNSAVDLDKNGMGYSQQDLIFGTNHPGT